MHQAKCRYKSLGLKRENVGRGLIQQDLTNKTTTLGLNK